MRDHGLHRDGLEGQLVFEHYFSRPRGVLPGWPGIPLEDQVVKRASSA
jgi:hypothetical protein